MNQFKTSINGKEVIFENDRLIYAGHSIPYNKMSNIAHRNGEPPAFVFDYAGKHLALPYNINEKSSILPFFQHAAALEQQKTEDSLTDLIDHEISESNTSTPQPSTTVQVKYSPANAAKIKGFWSVGRLVIGIVSMVLALFILFQSCAAGIYNALEETNDAGGSAGFFTAILMIAAGIVGICTRNSTKKVGPVITAILFFIGALLALCNAAVFQDLIVWGIVCVILGIVHVVCAIKTKRNNIK